MHPIFLYVQIKNLSCNNTTDTEMTDNTKELDIKLYHIKPSYQVNIPLCRALKVIFKKRSTGKMFDWLIIYKTIYIQPMVKLCHHLRSLNIEITDSPLGSTNKDRK